MLDPEITGLRWECSVEDGRGWVGDDRKCRAVVSARAFLLQTRFKSCHFM